MSFSAFSSISLQIPLDGLCQGARRGIVGESSGNRRGIVGELSGNPKIIQKIEKILNKLFCSELKYFAGKTQN